MKRIIFLLFLILIISLSSSAEGAPLLQDGLILVEGGTFLMGSTTEGSQEGPVHSVTISSFYMSPFEVTQGLWEAVMKETIDTQRSRMEKTVHLRGKGWANPMYYVSWYEAVEFCNKLSVLNDLDPCYSGSGEDVQCDFSANGYRLPTEAEWEYAARGGRNSKGYLYAGSNSLDSVGWFSDNSASKTQKVGQKTPNEVGVYDMSGNVYEWCWDRFGQYPEEDQVDPTGSEGLEYRVFRGGSWSHGAEYSRVFFRMAYPPDRRGNHLGFRIIRHH